MCAPGVLYAVSVLVLGYSYSNPKVLLTNYCKPPTALLGASSQYWNYVNATLCVASIVIYAVVFYKARNPGIL